MTNYCDNAVTLWIAMLSGQTWTLSGSKWACPNSLKIVLQKLRNLHLNCTQIACKVAQQESLCPPCSPWLNASSAPAHGRALPEEVVGLS